MATTGSSSERGLSTERLQQALMRIGERVPAGVIGAVHALLPDVPAPEAALNLFERLVTTCPPELLRLLDRHRVLIHYALVVFSHSEYLGETLIQNTDIFQAFLRERNLDRSHSVEEFRESFARYRSRSFESDIALLLARFKRREYVRIMLRDVLGIATLAETTAEISALADVLIEEALRAAESVLTSRYGPPQHLEEGRLVVTPFAILSLGKLGGKELNYNSDIDLLYLYGDGQEPDTAPISLREYFIRLGQQVTELLSRPTREGPVFRIDLRLRPQGAEGEPVVQLAHARRYYAESAHDWEMQAMIKVRHSAGAVALSREFLRSVQPFVYTERVNFAAIETALDTREKIALHRRRVLRPGKQRSIDVKLDRGGIRDIEFLVQCLQRVYGGAEPWLRSGGTLFSLQKLHDKGHISGKDFHELTSAYEFLRTVEHRLQLRHGQQTHKLPHTETGLAVLAQSVGKIEGVHTPAEFVAVLRRRMAAVTEIYDRIVHHQQLQQQREMPEFQLHSHSGEGSREQSYDAILARFVDDAPELYELASRREMAAHTRRNLHRFLSATFTSSERYAAVVEARPAVEHALELFAVSDFLTDILVRHPEEIATVARVAAGGPRRHAHGREGNLFGEVGPARAVAGDPVFRYLASSGVEYREKLVLLRRHYRHCVFASGARDVLELRRVYDSLAETTAAAEEAIVAANLVAESPAGFAVMALGRLGTSEFDLLSDADLLFVRDEGLDAKAAAKAAEGIMHALAAYTREGTVFPVDARLRPRGGAGELVLTPTQLESYFADEALAWEAVTYSKLRFITGCAEVGRRTCESTRHLRQRFAGDPGFAASLREMRTKLEKADAAEKNIKTSPGALYDVDFVTGYLAVRHGVNGPANLRDRLRVLAEGGLLSREDAAELDAAAELLRTTEHLIRLIVGRARKTLPVAGHARQTLESLVEKVLRCERAEGLEIRLERAFESVRNLYLQVVF